MTDGAESPAEHPLLSGARVALVLVTAALVAVGTQSIFGLAMFRERGLEWNLSGIRWSFAFWPPLCAAVGGFVGVTLRVTQKRTSKTENAVSAGAWLGALCAALYVGIGATALALANLGRPHTITLFTPVGDVILLSAIGGIIGAAIGAVAGRVFTQARASMAEATAEATIWLTLLAVSALLGGG